VPLIDAAIDRLRALLGAAPPAEAATEAAAPARGGGGGGERAVDAAGDAVAARQDEAAARLRRSLALRPIAGLRTREAAAASPQTPERRLSARWDVVYYCGCTRAWDPTVPGLLGGAEQAVLELSAAWARAGRSVAVFGNFSFIAGPRASPRAPWPSPFTSGGVELWHVDAFEASARFAGTLILWRAFEGFFDHLSAQGATVRAAAALKERAAHVPRVRGRPESVVPCAGALF